MALKTTLSDIKSRLTALLTYANGVTGESDTSIGDAIQTLADGYGQGGGLTPPQWCNVQTITIGSNSITNAEEALSYFTTNYPHFLLAVLNEGPFGENQTLLVVNSILYRWRNNAVGSAVIRSTYDARLIEGTHYDVYTY